MSIALIDRLAASVLEPWRRWRKTQVERAELLRLPEAERRRVLQDAGMTEYDISRLVAGQPGPGPESLLPGWLANAGVDIGYVRATEPALLRDMQLVCSRCTRWKQCESALDNGIAYDALCETCPNAPTIDSLIVGRGAHGAV